MPAEQRDTLAGVLVAEADSDSKSNTSSRDLGSRLQVHLISTRCATATESGTLGISSATASCRCNRESRAVFSLSSSFCEEHEPDIKDCCDPQSASLRGHSPLRFPLTGPGPEPGCSQIMIDSRTVASLI
eukprot:548032-Rhodomonas_salina.2